ncbi:MAG: hypothetical protein AAB970_00070 [Patescibacteria group bacterium]
MSKVKIIFGLAVWVAILSYLGFPYFLKNILFSITGLGIMYLCYLLYKDLKVGKRQEKTFDNFSENSDFKESEIKTEGHSDLNEQKI